jgi:glycosyltransferase involved in cell wall biosynthesis
MTIWFDAEDLIRYFQVASRPTGIQRLSFEILRAAQARAGASGEVRFCRRGAGGVRAIHFPALEAGIASTGAATVTGAPPLTPRAGRLRTALRQLPPEWRLPLGRLARAGTEAAPAGRALGRVGLHSVFPGARPGARIGGHNFELVGQAVIFAPGDWLVNLGASWDPPYDPVFLTRLRASGGRLALLAHDMIPALFPEWCTAKMVQDFAAWLDEVVPRADAIFAVSQNTAADFATCMQRRGRVAPQACVLPVGGKKPLPAAAPALAPLYILMVGTVEARKNHAAMLRVWRRLLAAMPQAEVPTLVIAGRAGWLTADLMQQFANANWLDGKVKFLDSPSEAELASLYRHCQFCVFPSLYEGWGLPVTEALSHGKVVAASNRGAIREAGGPYCAYFDPENINDAYNVIEGLITNSDLLAAMEARIVAEFHAPSWEDSAAVLLGELGLEDQGLWPEAFGLQSII